MHSTRNAFDLPHHNSIVQEPTVVVQHVQLPSRKRRLSTEYIDRQEAHYFTRTFSSARLQSQSHASPDFSLSRSQKHIAMIQRAELNMSAPDVIHRSPPSHSSKPNMTASSTITMAMLQPHFEKPLAQVAKIFGICVTLLKKICRKHGITRWPHRQIIGLRKSIASMEHAIGYFEGYRRESYAEQLKKQRAKLEALLEDPTRVDDVVASASKSHHTAGAVPPPSNSMATTTSLSVSISHEQEMHYGSQQRRGIGFQTIELSRLPPISSLISNRRHHVDVIKNANASII